VNHCLALQENYFPEIPPYEKKADLFYTSGYKVTFPMAVPSNVIRQMLSLSCRIRKWSLAWKTGFIIQEGNVEVLVESKYFYIFFCNYVNSHLHHS